MRINLILILTFACNAAGSMQKRASVLTDESKKILDMFDFSNFDKQEALSCIDRQRFENLIRGKRSKWYLTRQLLNSNSKLSSVDYENYNIQQNKYDALKGAESNKYSQRAILPKDDELKVHPRSDPKGIKLESFHLNLAQHGLRRERSAKLVENVKDTEQNNSELNKTNNDTIIERSELKDKHPDVHVNDKNDDDDDISDKEERRSEKRRRKKRKKKKRHHWSKWSEWSPCSVTCGKGRKIRSRKCIAKSCPSGEIEMGEKTCQLPACSLFDKLFSFLA